MSDPVPPVLDLNLLIDRLADCDSLSGAVAADDSTIANLKAQLDTLSEELAKSEPADPFADESACRRAIEIVAAIGKDPTFVAATAADRMNATEGGDAGMAESIGQYRILSRLGVGGMGAVYKALHTKLEKVVALKVLPADRLKDAGAVARFEREMRAVGKLHHPNIVAAHDAGEIGGTHYLVMELVEGIDLGSLLKQRGSLPVAEACEIIRQAALGLQHAHEHGLVHRDIKPSNLMLAEGQGSRVQGQVSRVKGQGESTTWSPLTLSPQPLTVKVLDLGLALLDENQRELAGELTSTGQIMGTLDYMAPEQGSDTHSVDIRADIYSLGATLYKLLTGRAPFEGPQYNTPMKKLTALATVDPQPVRELRPDVPPDLAALVHRMLAKLPEHRPTPPTAVAELLQPFSAGANLARLLNGELGENGTKLPLAESATDPTVVGPTELVGDAVAGPSVPAVAPATATTPTEPPNRRGRRVRTLLKAAAVLVPLALITIQMKQGTMTIRTDENLADDVKVVVKSGGEEVAVMDKDNNWTITIRAGEYQVETRGGNDEFTVTRDRVGVSRWGKTFVEVERKPERIVAEPQAPVEPDSETGDAHNFALQFDGRAAHVDIPSLTYDGSHPLTLEARVAPRKRLSADESTVVVGNIRDRTRKGGIVLRQIGAGWRATLFTDAGGPAYPTVTDDSLDAVSLALVYDLNETRLYVNGRLVHSVAIAPAGHLPSSEAFVIGGPGGLKDSTYFDGVIDEVRISRVARYAAEYTPTGRLEAEGKTLAFYHFDEGQGDVLHDASGHGHDGRIVGANWVRSGATLQPQPDGSGPYDPALERPIVEAVLQSGGSVAIVVPQAPANVGALQSYAYGTNLAYEFALLGQEQTLRSIDELPAEPFHITRVQLRRQAAIDPSLIESLARAPYLFELNLEGSAVKDGHAAVIGRMSQLRYLNAGLTGLTDEGLRELSRLSNLRYLAVWKAPGITDAGLEHIARLTNLVEIYLHENPQLSNRGIALLRELPHVGWLWLEGTGITDAALESVSGFEELDSLRLSRTKINGSGLTHLGRLRKLNWLFLHDTEVTDECGVLLKDVQFGSLWLSGTSVGDATLQAIAGRQDIHQLILNGTGITDAGLAHLKGTRIVHLSANNTALTGSGLGGLNIAEVLDLSGTQLSDEAAKSIARFKTLKVLNVAQTPVSEESVQSLAGALPNCTIYSKFGTIEPTSTPASVGTAPRWSPTAEQQAFLDAVALLPAEQQESAVREKLKAVNPGYDGFFEYIITDGKIVRLSLKGNAQTVREIWPIAALGSLNELLLGEAPVADLSSVVRLTNLQFLSCYGTAITNIAPVSALKKLGVFDCRETLVRDLSPLAGLPLKELRTFAVSPYNERFRQLAATWPQLETINDIPIAEFLARRDEVEELRKRLPAFPAERQLELVVEKLKAFNPGWDGGVTHQIVEGKLAHILLAAPHVVWDVSPLAALPDLKGLTCNGNRQLVDLSPLAGTQLEQLYCHASGIADLSPLRGEPLQGLVCGDNPIDDLSPLAGMPLSKLLCDNSPVSDLSPVTGCPLEQLSFSNTRVSDLSPLTGMPLKYVECGTTRVTSLEALRGKQLTFLGCGQNGISDLSPLAGMPLEELRCHYTQVRDFSPLADMPLTKLHVSSNDGLSDFSVLAGMPLAELDCRFSAVSDYSPLSGMPLERIAIDFHLLGAHDEEVLRSLPKVTEINSVPAAEFWRQIDQRRREAAEWKDALSALSGEQQLVTVRQQLTELHATFEYIPSFSLEPVYADGNLVELSIVVHSGDLTDLRPLCGLTHLRKLSLTGHLPHVRDLSPLYALALEELHVDSDVVLRSNTPGMRAMPTLQTINGRPAAEYLRLLDEPDRVTAEEVFRLGGKVVVLVPDEPEPRTIESVEALPAKVRRLDAVDLSYTQVRDEDLARLRHAAGLKTLFLDTAEHVSDAGLEHLVELPLRALDVRNTQVSDAGLPELLQLPDLTVLSLQHTAVTDAGMAVLARLPRLQTVVLSNNRISDTGVAQLRGMTSLRVLSIYDTQLTDAGLTDIATLVNLQDLSLSSTAVTDAGLKHLLPLQQLDHLFLERTAISDVGLAHLAALSNLRVLFLRETGIGDAGLTHLETAPVLQELFLERTRVTEEGIRQLHAARPLIRIHWDGGVIEPEAAEPAR